MAHPVEVIERDDCLILLWDRPGRLRVTVLVGLTLLLIFALFQLDVWILLYRHEGEWLLPLLRQSLSTWWVLALLAILVVLLVLDGRSRRKTIWAAEQMRISSLFGPIELFSETRRREDLPELVVRDDPGGAFGLIGGNRGRWQLALHFRSDNPGVRDGFLELGRFASEGEATALKQRLQSFQPSAPLNESTLAASPLSDIAAMLLLLLLRMPAVALFGLCLVVIGLAGESLAMRLGKIEPLMPWDSSTTATLERYAFRVEPGHRTVDQGRGPEPVEAVHSELQITVYFEDRDGRLRRRALTPLEQASPQLYQFDDGPRQLIESALHSGWNAERLYFEIPESLLSVPRTADGTFDFRQAVTNPSAPFESPAYLQHWRVLAQTDVPEQALPWLWTRAGIDEYIEIVYHHDDSENSPVWLRSEAERFRTELIDYNGMIYLMAIPAVLIGGLLFLFIAPFSHDALKVSAWLLLIISAWWWGPRLPGVPGWLDIDRGLQAQLRHQVASWLLPDPRIPLPLEAEISSGYWQPQGSRYADLLAELDLLHPPALRLSDVQAARMAIEAHTRQVLQLKDGPARERLLRSLPDARQRQEGNRWLIRDLVAPGVCAWLQDPQADPGFSRRHQEAIRALDC